jgi:hypothetical protein
MTLQNQKRNKISKFVIQNYYNDTSNSKKEQNIFKISNKCVSVNIGATISFIEMLKYIISNLFQNFFYGVVQCSLG